MGFLGGGTGSASSSISNSLVFNPIYTVGDGNESDSAARQEATSTATSTAKDEFGMSASVGILGGTGGTASLQRSGDDKQPMGTVKPSIANNPMIIYSLGGLAVLGTGAYLFMKKKR